MAERRRLGLDRRHARARPEPAQRDERGQPRAGRCAAPRRTRWSRRSPRWAAASPASAAISSTFANMLGAIGAAGVRVLRAAARLPLHLGGASARPRRLAGGAHHPAHHLPDRRHHRAAGHLPFPQVRRRDVRRRHGRHSGAARDRRADRRHHGRRTLGQLLHRRARLDEDARGDRRAAHHGLRSGRGADPAARAGAGHRGADPHLPRLDGGALRRRPGRLALWRHEPGDLHRAARRRRSRSPISRSA